MGKGLFYVLLSIFLILAAVFTGNEQITHFLAPAAEPGMFSKINDGALLFRIIIFIDGILLLLYSYYQYKGNIQASTEKYPPLWTPNKNQPTVWHEYSYYWQTVSIILIAAFILRIISLNSDLWIDEVFTVVNYVRLPIGQIVTDYSTDNQHIFFSVLSHISITIFGEHSWSIRLPSLLFGVASIWATMKLASLVFGKRIAIYAGLLMAISYHHIWFSQNARGYAILLFGATLSTYYLLKALQHQKWRYWIGYATISAFSIWTHITAVFISLAHGIVIFILLINDGNIKARLWTPLAGFLLTAWITIHLHALILPQMIAFYMQPGAGGGGLRKTAMQSPMWLLQETLRNLGISTSYHWIAIAGILALTIPVGYWLFKQDRVFTTISTLPGVLLFATMFYLGRNLWPRMFFFEMSAIIIMIVIALLTLGIYIRRKLFNNASKYYADFPLVILSILFMMKLPALYQYPKQDFTGARDYVRKNMGNNDKVIVLGHAGFVYTSYYAKEWKNALSITDMKKYQSTNGYTWVLYSIPDYIENVMPEISRSLKKDYTLQKIFHGTLGNGDIFVQKSNRSGQKISAR